MRVCLLLLGLSAAVLAADYNENPGYDIDNEALLVFSLVSAQNNGVDPTKIVDLILPSLFKDRLSFSKEKQLKLLSAGGLRREKATELLRDLLPIMKTDKKSTEEQTMAMLLATKQFCRKSKQKDSHCPDEEEIVVPLVALTTERGCDGRNIVTDGDVADNETCVCEDQSNMQFWISLFSQFSDGENLFPIIMMMNLQSATCNGTMKVSSSPCKCTRVNLGHEATLLQYLMTSPKVRALLTEEQRIALKNAIGTPEHRSTMNLNDYIYYSLAGVNTPQMLSLLQNRGESQDVILQNLVLSSIGLDSSMVNVILNGGFNDDPNKKALIRYMTNIGALHSSVIPLVFGVDKGKDFFFSNLVDSGNINPMTALIYQALQSGAPQEKILEYLTQAIAGARDPNYFVSLGRPYIPALPAGIFPGSQLHFAHFETLGVNTCALHDLRNRYDCGYVGISAAECETAPYCCYNPVFMTDVEVRTATDDAITSATAVPWCYYNVFFIFYESYYLTVKKPGEFAAPIQCLPLFKYGLRFDPNLYYLYDSANPSNGVGRFVYPREECGFPGMTEFQCVAIRGCCFDGDAPFRVPQCFKPNGPGQFNYDSSKIPEAYKAVDGACHANTYKIPLLYYDRVACHYPFKFYISGYNILAIPNPLDCLTKLGCCWERDEKVAETFPFVPRCYKRAGNVPFPSFIDPDNLITRSGDGNDTNSIVEQMTQNGYPPVPNAAGN